MGESCLRFISASAIFVLDLVTLPPIRPEEELRRSCKKAPSLAGGDTLVERQGRVEERVERKLGVEDAPVEVEDPRLLVPFGLCGPVLAALVLVWALETLLDCSARGPRALRANMSLAAWLAGCSWSEKQA